MPVRRCGLYKYHLMRLFRVLFLLTISLAATAQPGRSLVLKQQLAQTRADTTRSRLLCELGEQYAEVNQDSCFFYLNQSLQLARHVRDSVGMARAMYQLGYTHLYFTKDEGKVIDWLNPALAIARPTNNYACLANCYRLLAVISFHQHIGNAEELVKKALAYAQKSRNNKIIADTYGTYYSIIPDNFEQQKYLLKQAMAAIESSDPDLFFTVGLGYCDFLNKCGKHSEALAMARRLEAQTNRLQKTQGEFVYTCDMGRLFGVLKEYDRSETIMLAGIAAEKRRSYPDTVHLYHYYRYLLTTYLADEAWQKAYATRDSLATLQLWLQQKRQTRDAKLQMTQQKAAFDLEEKEIQIALLDAQKQQQQLLLAGVLLVAVLLVGFAIVQHRNRQRIEQQRTQLAQLNTTKDKLFATLSHDLRSPVSSLKNMLMLTDWGLLSQQEFMHSTRSLNGKVTNLLTMLENVLTWALSQMSGIRPQPETVALAPVVEQELALLRPLADTKGIHLIDQIPANAQLLADPNHLSIILRNLLQNALKFTPPGGAVHIGYTQTPDGATIKVRDTGIGMSSQMQTKLFRIDRQTTRSGTANELGTGLGLVLVADLVRANDGQISVESQEQEGSTFTVHFSQKSALQPGLLRPKASPQLAVEGEGA